MVNYLKHGHQLYRIPPLVDCIDYVCSDCKHEGIISVAEIIDQSMEVLTHATKYKRCTQCEGRLHIITDTVVLKTGKHMIILDASCNSCDYGTFKEIPIDMTNTGGLRF